MPDLDANANAIAIEHIKLENEGWERDTSVTEQKEPTLSVFATEMRPLNSADVLWLWETGQRLHPLDKALLALQTAFPDIQEEYRRLAAWPAQPGTGALARTARRTAVARLDPLPAMPRATRVPPGWQHPGTECCRGRG